MGLLKFYGFALILLLCGFGVQSASAQSLSVTPTTFNVVGLDSNNVNDGPNIFPVGARACNTSGVAVNNVTASFNWDSANANINLDAASANPVTIASLAPGACTELFFYVAVTCTAAAYDTKRGYHIAVSATGVPPVRTPMPREIYVERIISQSRNSIDSVVGPSSVFVGGTYTYTLNTSTATQGYEQLETFVHLPNTMFQVLAVNTTYTAPAGATNNKVYADACGWENNPSSPNYRKCVGPVNYAGGKAGGTISTVYTVKVLAVGSVAFGPTILDFSGSSYHYVFNAVPFSVTATLPPVPNVVLNKSVTPAGTALPGTDLSYTIAFSNTGTAAATSFIILDPIPANTDFKLGSASSSPGSTGLSVSIEYSMDVGTSWTAVPTSARGGAPAGYDRALTNVRWRFTGSLSPSAPNNAGSVAFTVRIR
jgi:uncharacterized repeat protein (TIGR01451 family)